MIFFLFGIDSANNILFDYSQTPPNLSGNVISPNDSLNIFKYTNKIKTEHIIFFCILDRSLTLISFSILIFANGHIDFARTLQKEVYFCKSIKTFAHIHRVMNVIWHWIEVWDDNNRNKMFILSQILSCAKLLYAFCLV